MEPLMSGAVDLTMLRGGGGVHPPKVGWSQPVCPQTPLVHAEEFAYCSRARTLLLAAEFSPDQLQACSSEATLKTASKAVKTRTKFPSGQVEVIALRLCSKLSKIQGLPHGY